MNKVITLVLGGFWLFRVRNFMERRNMLFLFFFRTRTDFSPKRIKPNVYKFLYGAQ